MSGITPLLDTLLHQVLGKRVDVQPPRDLNEPVRPVNPGEGPKALHSDSRLDGRRPSGAPLTGLSPTPQRGAAPSQRLPLAEATQQASAQTHFSASARTIADVLLRFPAPPSVLSTQVPLMRADEPPNATELAQRLQGGVRDSGLFYESHLSRWYRGEMSRQQLQREPQMMRTLQFTPVASTPSQPLMRAPLTNALAQGSAQPGMANQAAQTGATSQAAPTANAPQAAASASAVRQVGQAAALGSVTGAQGGETPAPRGSQVPQPMPGATGMLGTSQPASKGAAQAAGSYAATGALLPGVGAAVGEASPAASRAAPQPGMPGVEAASVRDTTEPGALQARGGVAEQPVHESLQSLVRHQLEMLVSPVLRWEGDVWSGIFMALMVQIPAAAQREGQGGEQERSDDGEEEQTWHSELRLEVPRLGEIKVALWLKDTQVRVELRSADEATLSSLRAGASRLQERLLSAGLEEALIDTRLVGGEDAGDG
ncbi:flagellar hook-length control protein FliK [Billgrantia gudaonensis]|uniref:Hook-length control protein FliK n=1 Tax=Billgrantia gudaonensis TaxID=376427 RepID=A0A1G8VGH5_9GAMM|nr:flagellar hook-length control protein FliK [Halomonas gudaonensis]SDJ65201.1 hook-length control protein FliK [Halomonas gudaonensis]